MLPVFALSYIQYVFAGKAGTRNVVGRVEVRTPRGTAATAQNHRAAPRVLKPIAVAEYFASLRTKYEAAVADNPVAMREIGRVLIQEGEKEEGLQLLKNAWQHGDEEAIPEYGKLIFESLSPEERAAFIEDVTSRIKTPHPIDPRTYFYYALLMRDGFVKPANPQESLKWMEVAANYKYPPAMALLALHLAKKPASDVPRLTELATLPVKLGIPEAQFASGLVLKKLGKLDDAFYYFKEAAEKGLKEAQLEYPRLMKASTLSHTPTSSEKVAETWYAQAVKNGNVYAVLELVDIYKYGSIRLNIASDIRKVVDYLFRYQDHPKVLQQAIVYLQLGYDAGFTKEQVLQLLNEAERLGSLRASYLLADSLMYNKHGQQDQARAVELFQRVANSNYLSKFDAVYQLALAYQHGTGVPVDLNRAVELYEISAKGGNLESQKLLAKTFRYGELGRAIDLRKSLEYYCMIARNQNDKASKEFLGSHIRFNDPIGSIAEKMGWYRAADPTSTDGFSQLQIGLLFWHSAGNDYVYAINHFKEAAKKGNGEAFNMLGEIYYFAGHIQPDYNLALVYFKQAAKKGVPRAFLNLGQFYESDLAGHKDMDRAIGFYRYAMDKYNLDEARHALERLNARDKPATFDVDAFIQSEGR